MPDTPPDRYATWYPHAPHLAADQQISVARAPGWTALRNEHIAKHPTCSACGYTRQLQVHHVMPVQYYPELELDPQNLLTLGSACPSGNHHYLYGHAQDWHAYVPTAPTDAAEMLDRIMHAYRSRMPHA